MNIYSKALVVCGVALLCGSASWAQVMSPAPDPAERVADIQPGILGPKPGPITGEPYSAETETTMSQTLADGTHIERKMSSSREYRDSQGRTRMEHYMPAGFEKNNDEWGKLLTVFIFDPVARMQYVLNPQDHAATEFALPPPSPPGTLRARRIVPQPQPRPDALKVTYESLGTDEMEGLIVDGQRAIMTIPAGKEGNDRPIEVVTDRWFSKDLQLWVLTKRTDPRSGETTTRVTKIDRSEPDLSLFEVPPDYTITQQQMTTIRSSGAFVVPLH